VRAAREAFAECFRRTFGVTPVPLIPYLAAEHLGLSDGAVQAVRGVEPTSLTAAEPLARARAVDPEPVPSASGQEEEMYE
jgi:hypothetical protein